MAINLSGIGTAQGYESFEDTIRDVVNNYLQDKQSAMNSELQMEMLKKRHKMEQDARKEEIELSKYAEDFINRKNFERNKYYYDVNNLMSQMEMNEALIAQEMNNLEADPDNVDIMDRVNLYLDRREDFAGRLGWLQLIENDPEPDPESIRKDSNILQKMLQYTRQVAPAHATVAGAARPPMPGIESLRAGAEGAAQFYGSGLEGPQKAALGLPDFGSFLDAVRGSFERVTGKEKPAIDLEQMLEQLGVRKG